jgi:secondary thiamine-phosphate synthase enzyme
MSVINVKSETIKLRTKGHSDVVDITGSTAAILTRSGVASGIITLFVIGSTAGLTTIEFEPGLVHDIKTAFELIAPQGGHYEHHERWGDDNGNSHVRASLLGPSLTVPFNDGKLCLGTWQQIVLIDFDTKSREREIVCQILGR